ncbi:MAG: tetratricopeptide repeat protein [Nannocystaceae bacterium]
MDIDFDNQPTLTLDAAILASLRPSTAPPRPVGVDPNSTWSGERARTFDEARGRPDAPAFAEVLVAEESALAEAEGLDHQGWEASALGRYREARVCHERAMERRLRADGADPQTLRSLCSLGAVAFHQGRVDEGEWHFSRARGLAESSGLAGSPQMAMILNNLGVIARVRGDVAAALAHYEAALAIKVGRLGWEHTSVAVTLINLGRLAERAGEERQALGHFAQARAIAEITEGVAGPTLAAALLGLGRLHLRRGASAPALVALERALRIREAIASTPAQLAAARVLTSMALARRRPDEARALVLRARREYLSSESARADNVEAMTAWIALLDARLKRGC